MHKLISLFYYRPFTCVNVYIHHPYSWLPLQNSAAGGICSQEPRHICIYNHSSPLFFQPRNENHAPDNLTVRVLHLPLATSMTRHTALTIHIGTECARRVQLSLSSGDATRVKTVQTRQLFIPSSARPNPQQTRCTCIIRMIRYHPL